MGIDRGMVALVDFAEPFGQDAVERHGDQDAGHADVAVVHDLVRIEDVTQTNDQDDDRAARTATAMMFGHRQKPMTVASGIPDQ